MENAEMHHPERFMFQESWRDDSLSSLVSRVKENAFYFTFLVKRGLFLYFFFDKSFTLWILHRYI